MACRRAWKVHDLADLHSALPCLPLCSTRPPQAHQAHIELVSAKAERAILQDASADLVSGTVCRLSRGVGGLT